MDRLVREVARARVRQKRVGLSLGKLSVSLFSEEVSLGSRKGLGAGDKSFEARLDEEREGVALVDILGSPARSNPQSSVAGVSLTPRQGLEAYARQAVGSGDWEGSGFSSATFSTVI